MSRYVQNTWGHFWKRFCSRPPVLFWKYVYLLTDLYTYSASGKNEHDMIWSEFNIEISIFHKLYPIEHHDIRILSIPLFDVQIADHDNIEFRPPYALDSWLLHNLTLGKLEKVYIHLSRISPDSQAFSLFIAGTFKLKTS